MTDTPGDAPVDPRRFKIVEDRTEILWTERLIRVQLTGYAGTAFRLLWPVLIGIGAAAIARYTVLDCVKQAALSACQ